MRHTTKAVNLLFISFPSDYASRYSNLSISTLIKINLLYVCQRNSMLAAAPPLSNDLAE
jgi:hypothetical protein